jgi:hypothetical protein
MDGALAVRPLLLETYGRGVGKHQSHATKDQRKSYLTPPNSYGVNNGRHRSDKNPVEDIVAKNCAQANFFMSTKLGNHCCRKLWGGRAHRHNVAPIMNSFMPKERAD